MYSWIETVFVDFGKVLIRTGGFLMGFGVVLFQRTEEMIQAFLTLDPFSVSGIQNLWELFRAAGLTLAIVYFSAGFLRQTVDIHAELNLEGIFKALTRLVLVLGIISLSLELGRCISSTAIALISGTLMQETGSLEEKMGESRDDENGIDSEAEEYGYFSGIYRFLEDRSAESLSPEDDDFVLTMEEKTTAGEWILAGIVCLAGGLIGGVAIVSAACEILLISAGRIFRLALLIPFAPISLAPLAEGRGGIGRGTAWIRTFTSACAEAVVIALALRLTFLMFSSFQISTAGMGVIEGVLCGILNLVCPLLAAATVSREAAQIASSALGT